jgi:hypothetical protein
MKGRFLCSYGTTTGNQTHRGTLVNMITCLLEEGNTGFQIIVIFQGFIVNHLSDHGDRIKNTIILIIIFSNSGLYDGEPIKI